MSRFAWGKFKFWIPAPDARPFPILPLRTKAYFKGRRDGRLGIPGVDDQHFAPFEARLKQKIDFAVRNLAADWHTLDGKLHQGYCALQAELRTVRSRLQELRDAEQRLAAARKGAEERAEPHLQELRLPLRFYWPLIVLLGIVEIPMNSLVFQIFGEGTLMTYLFASGLAIMLPVSGHFLGILTRRAPHRRRQLWAESTFLALCVLVPLATMVGIAYLRQKFMEASDVAGVLGVEMSPLAMTMVILSFNVLIYLGASVASYLSHDPEFEYVVDRLADAKRSLASCRALLERLQAREAQIQEELKRLRARRNSLCDEYRLRAHSIEDWMFTILEVYREHNLRARARKAGNVTRPRTFGVYPQIKAEAGVPEKKDLDWTCDQYVEELAETGDESR